MKIEGDDHNVHIHYKWFYYDISTIKRDFLENFLPMKFLLFHFLWCYEKNDTYSFDIKINTERKRLYKFDFGIRSGWKL